MLFIIKMRRVWRLCPQHSAQYYIKARGAGMTSPPGCRGGAPAASHDVQHVEVETGGDDVGEGDGDEEHHGEDGDVFPPGFEVEEE